MQPENTTPSQSAKKVGPIVSTLVIVLILVIAALYLFASKVNKPAIPETNDASDVTASTTTTTGVQPITSTSDDPSDIMNDLNSSTNGVDQQNF